MSAAEHLKRTSFTKNASTEHVKSRAPSTAAANTNVLQRPLSAFSRHKIHELSDIREASGSSRDSTVRKKLSRTLDGANDPRVSRSTSHQISQGEVADLEDTSEDNAPTRPRTSPRGLGSRGTSALSLPMKDVPERRSSASFLAKGKTGSRQSSVNDLLSWKLPTPTASGQVIPPRGRANSPVKKAVRHDAVSSDTLGRSPAKTFIRTTPPLDILDLSNIRHGHIEMSLQTPAPLFVGGGTIEGHLMLTVDGGTTRKNKIKPLLISRLSMDVVGVEEVTDGRRWIFLSLATELFDEQHPPPASLVASQAPASGTQLSWPLKPASVVIPFCLNLPLNIGPPPYTSKNGRIRYILCATAYVKLADKLALVRHSFEIQMLTVYDPEKALSSLPTPLLATDQLSIPQGIATHNIRLTAGLHRQTWVNGAMIFVDVHIMNNSPKTIKKIEVQLEKTTLWYSHAAAGTTERSGTHLRLPKRSDSELVCTSIIKKSKEWKGVLPSISEVRTCDLEVPRGHVTISTGRYFEVRYFLNVIISVTMFKSIAVQLPVTIIHINSLDIVPNSLAQVAASIEAKRARTVPVANNAIYPSFNQGQAFAAPRRQSLERMRRASSEAAMDQWASLRDDVDASPRRFARASAPGHSHKTTMSAALSAENHQPGILSMAPSLHRHHSRHNSCYHCHLQEEEGTVHCRHKSSMASLPGPKLPRLQLSTSGLGFSDSDFEIASDSPPRKVMLSESERKLILQRRELRLQRQVSQNNQNHLKQQQTLQRQRSVTISDEMVGGEAGKERVDRDPAQCYRGWRNVAAQPMAPNAAHVSSKGLNMGMAGSTRSRSNTGPIRLGMSMSGPSVSRNKPGPTQGQGQGMTRGSMDRGLREGSRERARVPFGVGGGASGRESRKSVENW